MEKLTTPEQPDYSSPAPSAPDENQPISGGDYSEAPTSSRSWLPALGLGLLLLLGGGGWWWWQHQQKAATGGPMAGMPQSLPVSLGTVQRGAIAESSEFVGNLEARNTVTLKPEIEGRVSQIYVEPGQRVSKGTPLVQLSPEKRQAELASVLAGVNSARAAQANARSQLQSLQAQRASLEADVELQQAQYRRIASLVKEGAYAQQNLDVVDRDLKRANAELRSLDERIQAARSGLQEAAAGVKQAQANANLATVQLQDAAVNAPFAGVVGDIPVKLGDYVKTSDTLTSLTSNDELDLRLSIPLERQADLRPGLTVEMLDPQGKPFKTGKISFIAPQVTANAQSILAKASFPNPDGQLLNAQFVRARVIWNRSSGVLVPTSAISRLGNQAFVFVAEEKGTAPDGKPQMIAKQQAVELGTIQGNNYQVLKGLQGGERIVTGGILNLQDGAPIMPLPPAGAQPKS